jgi:hypothetical protein
MIVIYLVLNFCRNFSIVCKNSDKIHFSQSYNKRNTDIEQFFNIGNKKRRNFFNVTTLNCN